MSTSEEHPTTAEANPDSRERLVPAANLFRLAGDPTRLAILHTLRAGDRNVTQLLGDLGLGLAGQPRVSYHLALLRHSGLVRSRRAGQNSNYSLTEAGAALARVAADLAADRGAP